MTKFIDITEQIINNDNLYPIIPELVSEYVKINKEGNIVIYNEFNCRFDDRGPKLDEMDTINYLKDKLRWNIEIIKRINEDGISTPDIRRVDGFFEYWDIKNIYRAESINSRKQKIMHRITKQCNNFIFDLRNDMCDLTNEEAVVEVTKIYNKKTFLHVNMIVLLGKNNFIKCYRRK